MIYDIIIRIDKMNTDLTEDEIRNKLSKYISNNILCDKSKIQIFKEVLK